MPKLPLGLLLPTSAHHQWQVNLLWQCGWSLGQTGRQRLEVAPCRWGKPRLPCPCACCLYPALSRWLPSWYPVLYMLWILLLLSLLSWGKAAAITGNLSYIQKLIKCAIYSISMRKNITITKHLNLFMIHNDSYENVDSCEQFACYITPFMKNLVLRYIAHNFN